ncbi:MAG: lysophospholipid acyltransferase family protein [Bacillota bacterium]
MFYRFAWVVCRFFLLTVRRMEILGTENIPLQGGLVLVSNHRSYWDPVVIGCALPKTRQVFFMAKHELFQVPLLGPVITKLGAFPVKRGGADRSAIRTALDHLANGRLVGIFPEGTRSKNEDMLEPHMGAAMLSTRTGSPVLPVAVIGTKGFWGKVKIVFGTPMIPDLPETGKSKAGRNELTVISLAIMDRVADLMVSKSGDNV